ncbi:hypothetical protein N7494_013006 [Penicillium frequentans]|uniref:Transcription factor domain-containing protein n=1 Tax=Penicillium frequentans TaxID=3151616 RepID=A0AAD6GAL3_9EURO|nr:hypothetical protein N7494_013006 [Penicillium glabrum]
MYVDKCPPADFSLLVLAMYLVTLDPSDDSRKQITPPQTLYLDLRMSFTRVQILITASTRLIQTGLLLAAYDYACGRPHAAYISIGTCVRMASILGIDRYNRLSEPMNGNPATGIRTLETQNMYWAMIMLERLVLYECPFDHLKPALDFPSPETQLPSDLISPTYVHSHSSPDVGQSATVGDLHSANVGSFGRQIQAISFLVQVLKVTDDSNAIPLSELIKLDEKLRGFLTILMSQCPAKHQCGANGVMIRSLVRLHQYILKRPCTPGHPEAKIQEQSHAALDTLARMMIEVAHDHLKRFVPGKIDSLPLSCSYNMRSMMDLMEDRWGHISSKHPPKGLEAFVALHEAVCKRWRSSLEH